MIREGRELLFAPGSPQLRVLEIWLRVVGLDGASSRSLPPSLMYYVECKSDIIWLLVCRYLVQLQINFVFVTFMVIFLTQEPCLYLVL